MSERDIPGQRHLAKTVAMQYHEGLAAPLLLGKASGRAAEHAVALARDHGIPVIQDDLAVEALFTLPQGVFVPPEYWELAAKVLIAVRNVSV